MRTAERDWLRACAEYLRLCTTDGVFIPGRRCADLAEKLDAIAAPPAVVLGGNVVPFVRPAAASAPLAQEKQS